MDEAPATTTEGTGDARAPQNAQEVAANEKLEMTIDDYKDALAKVRAEAAASRVELKELKGVIHRRFRAALARYAVG